MGRGLLPPHTLPSFTIGRESGFLSLALIRQAMLIPVLTNMSMFARSCTCWAVMANHSKPHCQTVVASRVQYSNSAQASAKQTQVPQNAQPLTPNPICPVPSRHRPYEVTLHIGPTAKTCVLPAMVQAHPCLLQLLKLPVSSKSQRLCWRVPCMLKASSAAHKTSSSSHHASCCN